MTVRQRFFGMNWEAMHGIMSSCGKNWQRKTHTGKWWAKQHGSSIFSWMSSAMSWKAYDIQKRVLYPPKESNRDRLCGIIDTILAEKPEDYEAFLQKLEQQGFEVKRGKHTAVKGKGQKRFIRFRTLGTGYGENEIKAVLEGKAEHKPYQKKPPKEQPFQLLVDIQGKWQRAKASATKSGRPSST